VTQARYPRIAPKVCFRESQKHGGAMLVNSFLRVPVHSKAQTRWACSEQARIQTAKVLSLCFSAK
jgi:hypothetical protein